MKLKMMRKTLIIALLSLLIIIFTNCSTQFLPRKSELVQVQEDFGIIKTNNQIYIAQNRFWNKSPQQVNDYFTTFFITIKNQSKETIEFTTRDVSLLDAEGNQFDAISIDYIEKLLLPDEIRFEHVMNVIDDQPNVIEDWQEAKGNLLRDSFHFGSILPNASRSGYLFFARLPNSHKKCKIIIKNKEIEFIRNEKNKE